MTIGGTVTRDDPCPARVVSDIGLNRKLRGLMLSSHSRTYRNIESAINMRYPNNLGTPALAVKLKGNGSQKRIIRLLL
jgi:hypothetical protein